MVVDTGKQPAVVPPPIVIPAPVAVAAIAPVAPIAPAPLAAALVAPVAAFAPAALIGAGVPLAVTVPAGAAVLQVTVLTVPPAVAAASVKPRGRVLLRIFHNVTRRSRAHTVRFRLRSRKLYKQVRHGRRYVLEIRPGVNRKTLGKPTRTAFRVR